MPADLGSSTWSEIDASNNAVPPNGWPEGMAPSDVNNSARAQMGGEKRWWDRSNATQTTTGTSTAYVLTYAAAESALYDGEETSFVLHTTTGATPTLNRDGLGAKSLRRFDFATNAFISVGAGDFRTNQVLRVRYNLSADRYDVIAASTSPGDFVATNSNNTFTGTNTFANTVTVSGAAFNEAVRVDVASASTCNIGAAASNYVRITGTTTITGLGTIASGVRRKVVFAGILTLTHNATSLILPNNGGNITTAAGDCAEFESEGSGNWRCTDYQRASGLPLGSPRGYTARNATGYTLSSSYTSPMKITEGIQLFSHTYTAENGNTILVAVDIVNCGGSSTTQALGVFINSATNSVATSILQFTNVAYHQGVNRVVYALVSSGSATDVEIRIAGGGIIGTAVLSISEFRA